MGEIHLMHTTTKALDIDALQGWDSIIHGTSDHGDNDEFYIDKSAAVLSMLHSAIKEDNFRSCLGRFLKMYKYMTAEPNDLWFICSKKMNNSRNVKEMMNLWTNLPGFPLVNVTVNGTEVIMTQSAFHPADFIAIHEDPNLENDTDHATTTISSTTHSSREHRRKNSKWIFPVNYVTNTEMAAETVWINTTESKIHLKKSALSFIIFHYFFLHYFS